MKQYTVLIGTDVEVALRPSGPKASGSAIKPAGNVPAYSPEGLNTSIAPSAAVGSIHRHALQVALAHAQKSEAGYRTRACSGVRLSRWGWLSFPPSGRGPSEEGDRSEESSPRPGGNLPSMTLRVSPVKTSGIPL